VGGGKLPPEKATIAEGQSSSGSSDGKDWGFFGAGANFIFRLGKPRNMFFPLGLIAEASCFLGGAQGKGFIGEGNIGGGLRLAMEEPDFPYFPFLDLSASGGVSFTGDAGAVPYLRIGASAAMFTGGVFIRFYPDDANRSPVIWYAGVKFKLGK
jgi:hypothetical protein